MLEMANYEKLSIVKIPELNLYCFDINNAKHGLYVYANSYHYRKLN